MRVGAVAHGGFCVARHEGRVVFVRHALPGELVRVTVTEGKPDSSYWRADAVEVIEAAEGRVEPPCPWSGPGRCGGCDWQHASLDVQRKLKAAVVREQLARLANLDVEVVVEPVPGDSAGLDWRTRVTYAVSDTGRAGLRAHRSHEIVPIDECRIAHPLVRDVPLSGNRWPGGAAVDVSVSPASGDCLVLVDGVRDGSSSTARDEPAVYEEVAGRSFRVTGGGFWQVHPGAAEVLRSAVLDALQPEPGDSAADLYGGAGLFADALAERVGPAGRVTLVEGDRVAVADARHNLRDREVVRIERGRVDHVLRRRGSLRRADLVVLDPPRSGAGRAVVDLVAQLHPRRIAYVACDPAALARDLTFFAERGHVLAGLRAFDLFPMTHHIECLATLMPG